MIRLMPPVLAMLVLVGCDRPAPAPRDAPASREGGFDNAAASRSIMQPAVVAASDPTPTPTPTPPPTGATVQFAHGAQLDDAARRAIDNLLAASGLPAQARYVLRGSSDTGGSDAANLATSRRRAEAVRDYLISKGIAADRVEVIALGDGRPVAPNVKLDGSDDPAGQARNRRVDIAIVPPSPDAPDAPDAAPDVEASPAVTATANSSS